MITTNSCKIYDDSYTGNVRTIAVGNDKYAGLKGHDYIKARNLNRPVQKIVQTSAHAALASQKDACK